MCRQPYCVGLDPVLALPAALCVRERTNFGRLGSFSFFSYIKNIGNQEMVDKKKICGIKLHNETDTIWLVMDLICGIVAVDGKYNLMHDTKQG